MRILETREELEGGCAIATRESRKLAGSLRAVSPRCRSQGSASRRRASAAGPGARARGRGGVHVPQLGFLPAQPGSGMSTARDSPCHRRTLQGGLMYLSCGCLDPKGPPQVTGTRVTHPRHRALRKERPRGFAALSSPHAARRGGNLLSLFNRYQKLCRRCPPFRGRESFGEPSDAPHARPRKQRPASDADRDGCAL